MGKEVAAVFCVDVTTMLSWLKEHFSEHLYALSVLLAKGRELPLCCSQGGCPQPTPSPQGSAAQQRGESWQSSTEKQQQSSAKPAPNCSELLVPKLQANGLQPFARIRCRFLPSAFSAVPHLERSRRQLFYAVVYNGNLEAAAASEMESKGDWGEGIDLFLLFSVNTTACTSADALTSLLRSLKGLSHLVTCCGSRAEQAEVTLSL